MDIKQQLRHFTVGITPTCGEFLVGRVFTSYCGAHPHTNISLVTGTLEAVSYTHLDVYKRQSWGLI